MKIKLTDSQRAVVEAIRDLVNAPEEIRWGVGIGQWMSSTETLLDIIDSLAKKTDEEL